MPNLSINNFLKHPSLELKDGIYRQKDLPKDLLFEDQYIALRKIEGRLYDDEVVAKLPEIDSSSPTAKEWSIRKRSANRLIKLLKEKQPQTILEIGCGNGWLINYVQSSTNSVCMGVDVNATELKQASRVFGSGVELSFIYANIFSEAFGKPLADVIILASVIQYFPDAESLILRLLNMLNPHGQIHILDSPIYGTQEISRAKARSEDYFTKLGFPEMRLNYHHHSWDVLKAFQYSILYNPNSFLKKIERRITYDSPFSWIVIDK